MATSKKRRTTYPQELRAEAKARGHGLVTISIEFPNGERLEEQKTADVLQAQFAKWAMVLLFTKEAQSLPDLEGKLKQMMEEA